jgi:hypothetical protein
VRILHQFCGVDYVGGESRELLDMVFSVTTLRLHFWSTTSLACHQLFRGLCEYQRYILIAESLLIKCE